jgi:SAM-dependent methyltransferase
VSLWGRALAATYDPCVRRAAELEAARAELLARARGQVLEVGAGTGLNRRHYPAGTDVTFTEPDLHMARRGGPDLIPAGAEELPFTDGAFDTVVSTLVLCSVQDLPRALAEIRRVLRPDGQLLLIEHIRAPDGTRLARVQDRVNPVWRRVAGGCNCNRDTLASLADAGFSVDVWPLPFEPPLVRPVVAGVAVPS